MRHSVGADSANRPCKRRTPPLFPTVPEHGIAPGFTDLHQLNLQVPQLAPGDYLLTLQLGTLTIPTGAFITID